MKLLLPLFVNYSNFLQAKINEDALGGAIALQMQIRQLKVGMLLFDESTSALFGTLMLLSLDNCFYRISCHS